MARTLKAVQDLNAKLARPTMNILRVASAVKAGETITIGSTVFEVQSAGQVITAGRVAIDLTAAPTAAAAALVLTFAANASNNDTVTINSQVYTFKTTLTASTTANEVLIGVDLTSTRNNLVAAITSGAGGGATYGSLTVANTAVTATPSSTNALTATAKVEGTAGNSIAVAETGSQISWAGGATALTGGVDPTAAEAIPAIIAAINTSRCGLSATAGGANDIMVQGSGGSGQAIATTETLAGSNNVWAAATTYGGSVADENLFGSVTLLQRAANATEVAVGAIRFPCSFTPKAVFATLRTTDNKFKTFDGATTVSGNTIVVDNSGSSDWAADDVINIMVAF